MMRKVHMEYRASYDVYTLVSEDLMNGECQGKTLSPASWDIYTIPLLRALENYNPGMTVACVEVIKEVKYIADVSSGGRLELG